MILPSFSFIDTTTTEIYTLSLHDALPISAAPAGEGVRKGRAGAAGVGAGPGGGGAAHPGLGPAAVGGVRRVAGTRQRSEEHTSELQSRRDLVCRLLLEKKNSEYDIHRQHA